MALIIGMVLLILGIDVAKKKKKKKKLHWRHRKKRKDYTNKVIPASTRQTPPSN